MCGIVGMSFRYRRKALPRTDRDLTDLRTTFTEMLLQAQSRGSAATGVLLSYYDRVFGKNKMIVVRAPIPASEFVKSNEYNNLINKISNDTYFILGHTRAVTNGSAENNKNNHPHRVGHILGMHNGAIKNHNKLWKECEPELIPQGTCDSEAIFAKIEKERLAQKDMHAAVESTMRSMDGWYTLVMTDTREPSKLVFVRDNTTPLHMAWIDKLRVTLLSSEKDNYVKGIEKSTIPKVWAAEMVVNPMTIHTLDSLYENDVDSLMLSMTKVDLKSYETTEEDAELLSTTLKH